MSYQRSFDFEFGCCVEKGGLSAVLSFKDRKVFYEVWASLIVDLQ